MKPSIWPDAIETTFLAKSAARGEGGAPESLARHTWQVLSRLADFIHLRPAVPAQLGQPRLWHILYWATFLHDFGKAMPGFQGLLRGDASSKEIWSGHRHEVFSLAFVDWIVSGLTELEREWFVFTIVSHHKDAQDIRLFYSHPEEGETDSLVEQLAGLSEDHIQGLHQWLIQCGWAWAVDLSLEKHGVAPLTFTPAPQWPFTVPAMHTIRHWLRQFFIGVRGLQRQYDPSALVPLLTLRGTLINSDHSGSAHAGPLPRFHFSATDILQELAPHDPYDHQDKAGQTMGSALLIAPTGSGKTEAALLWAAHQDKTLSVTPRLFYTLPYQASMNAMYLRLRKTFGDANQVEGEEQSRLVALQHGRSSIALYNSLIDNDGYAPNAAVIRARRFRNLANLNYPPVRVFSPYQMLKWMYRLKGYESHLADYHNALFIFDEIHAYEVKRLALILKTIAYLRCYYNARFFIMSATFPTIIKKWLQDALAIDDSAEIMATKSLFSKFQRHRLNLIEGDLLENLDRVDADARAGRSVLVVCNWIPRAQQAYEQLQALKKEDIEVILLHGRFNLHDRSEKEQKIRDFTGVKGPQGEQPNPLRRTTVVIATQVVEVSLDIDLDTIYSDPAPLEALVQRFGRVNRARRNKGLAPVNVFTMPDDGQKIYDPLLIAGTLRILRRENGLPIDESNIGKWLDEIYSGDIATAWKKEYAREAVEFENAVLDSLRPFQSDVGLKETFYRAFDGVEVVPETLLPDNDWDAFERQLKDKPFEARQKFVSISYRSLSWIRQKRRVLTEQGHWPIIVDLPYSAESGLDFSVLYED